MIYGIKIIGTSQELWDEEVWLVSYDPDAEGGIGHIEATDDPANAMRFDTWNDAMLTWRRKSTVAPVRLDGQPNRPLSAFSVAIVSLEEVNDSVA